MVDDPTPRIAVRLHLERTRRGWSLERFAGETGVSKAMLSKLERAESSPTAAMLGRISGALGITVSSLLGEAGPTSRVLRAGGQPSWRDPETGYLRRQVSPLSDLPFQLVEVVLPPNTHVEYPASAYAFLRQVIWVLEGRLEFHEGHHVHQLYAGDCLELGEPQDCVFVNSRRVACRYLVVVASK